MTASINFTGKVERVKEWDDGSASIDVHVDDGSKYGGRARVSTKLHVEPGDIVSVTTERLPYGKTRAYTTRDGENKTATDLIYTYAQVEIVEPVEGCAVEDDLGDDIPF